MEMLLDNRKAVPDIIVSRDIVPNRVYNINNNFSDQMVHDGEVRRDDVNFRQSQQSNRIQSNKFLQYPYSTGNNNGSPLHVPFNGNYYNETKAPTNDGIENNASPQATPHKVVKNSPTYMVRTPLKTQPGSPRIKTLNQNFPYTNNYSGKVLQNTPDTYKNRSQDGTRKVYDNFKNNSENNRSKSRYLQNTSNENTPIHEKYGNVNPQRLFYSPRHVPQVNYLISPRKYQKSPNYCGEVGKNSNIDEHSPYNGKSFRLRSSSHPSEKISILPPSNQSRIPVHIGGWRSRINDGSASTGNNSPYRSLNKTSRIADHLKLSRKGSAPEVFSHNNAGKPGKYGGFNSPQKGNFHSRLQHGKFRNAMKTDCNKWNTTPKKLNSKTDWNNKENKFTTYNQLNENTFQWKLDDDNMYLTVDTDTLWNAESENGRPNNFSSNGSYNSSGSDRSSYSARQDSWSSSGNERDSFSGYEDSCEFYKAGDSHYDVLSDKDSGCENDNSFNSKMVIIKCKEASYLTKLLINNEGIHGLRLVGRVGGAGRTAQSHGMNIDQPTTTPIDLNSNHSASSDDVRKREMLSENAISLSATDTEFVHEAADYQWLLDYDMTPTRYRECYARDCLGSSRDGSARVSVLQQATNESLLPYEVLSRNIDASLAHIDMDDFRSEDIHQILSMPTMCDDLEDEEEEEELYRNFSGSLNNSVQKSDHEDLHSQNPQVHHPHGGTCEDNGLLRVPSDNREDNEEDLSGVSGEGSLYQSGPLFSPLREPQNIPPSFSVDSLDSDSIHDDLILTCQANKNNYTIAFEGSFIQYSEDSDFQEHAGSDTTGSGSWSTERLEGRSPAPDMTHSDQPYTTWSRVSRRSSQSRTPDHMRTHRNSPLRHSPARPMDKSHQRKHNLIGSLQQEQENKSNSLPNLMRRSLMRKSLEASGQCMKVYDLQLSFRSSHLSNTRSVDANNISLMRLFMKQKSLSKDAVSISSSLTDPSQEGVCSSSENQSCGNESSDWPMNSQSENDMDGSASPVPITATNNHIIHGRTYNRRDIPLNIMALNQVNSTNTNEVTNTETMATDGLINNNNNLANLVDDSVNSITGLEDSLKDTVPCSKPPVTSPIREEPEGMDLSMDNRQRSEISDNVEKKEFSSQSLSYKDNNTNNVEQPSKLNVKSNKNILNISKEKASQELGTPNHMIKSEELNSTSQRKRQESGNSSSGYASNRGSTEKIKRSLESEKFSNAGERPKPKPRLLKQFMDQGLQTSNLKVSAMVNTSALHDTKDVYVYYPNYALPDLSFLKEKKYNVDTRIFLVPQHYMHGKDGSNTRKDRTKRPFSCGDLEKLRKLGFSHIKDWDSLNYLLPKELKEMLFDNSECMETQRPSFCTPTKIKSRSASCDSSNQRLQQDIKESKFSSCSNSTQPSSGYRGSSTLLNDSGEGTTDQCHALEDGNDITTARPMLPKGILRKCSSLRDDSTKAGITKRHSANISRAVERETTSKRHSLQEPIRSAGVGGPCENEVQGDVMTCSCEMQCTGFCAKGLRKKNLLLVNELPEVSSHEDLTEADLARLRSQVSEFLVSKGSGVGTPLNNGAKATNFSGDCHKKSVSFEERKSANHSSKKGSKENSTSGKKDFSCNEGHQRRSVNLDEDFPPMLFDAHDKKTLVLSVRNAVEKLVKHFNKGRSQQDKNKLGTSSMTPDVAHLVLEKLCPAIYALLSDGLLPSLHSLFGKISNSVWRAVEATSQIGPSTKALNDLVLTLNSEECLSEGPVKFNAFIFGLLNIRSLDAWLGYLRTRECALQKHYHPEAFLYLSNTAMRGLYDDFLHALRPLALLPFRLDILHEYKALHASLLKMEERLALHSAHCSIEAPMDLLASKKESKEFRNVTARTNDRSHSPRPRSCHENGLGCENGQSNQNALKKRWSGIQLGSKLVTALDKLMAEDAGGNSSEDYSDSLETPKRKVPSRVDDKEIYLSDDCATDMRISDLSSKDGDISERSATYKDTDTEKGFLKHNGKNQENESEGEKFRRLQLKWEAMTGYLTSPSENGKSNLCDSEKNRCDNVISPAGTQRSRIPRPVSITSPNQPFKPFDASKEKTSPLVKQGKRVTSSKEPQPQPAPRKSLKDRVLPTEHHQDSRISVKSRINQRTPVSLGSGSGSLASNRASSVPGRKAERGNSSGRYETLKKSHPHRSASHGRKEKYGARTRLVQTLHHRLATDNGHLSFNRGDVLSVIVEVDEKFLLCALQDRKGLVPRASVVVYHH